MNEIDYIGYNAVHPADFIFDVKGGHDCYLLLLITTPAEFLIDDVIKRVPANSAILYSPGYRIYYRACEGEYHNDWIRFRSDESYVNKFALQNIPFSVNDLEYCHNLMKLLTWESTLSSSNSELSISHLLRVLFLKLSESLTNQLSSSHTSELISLHKRIHNNPQLPWSVNQMANELHLSAGYLQTIYRQMFGSSCMDDVIKERLRRAKDQLIYTTNSVSEIAENCGYNNVEHFCRQFRQFNNCSPSRFRTSIVKSQQSIMPSHSTLGGVRLLIST